MTFSFANLGSTQCRSVGLLGCGAIGASIISAWQQADVEGFRLATVCARPYQLEALKRTLPPSVLLVDNVAALIASGVDLVIETAGQGAVRDFAARILGANIDLHVLSVGALVCDALMADLEFVVRNGGGRLFLPAGALAGFDGLRSMRWGGFDQVLYRSIKPPNAWRGTPIEHSIDLAALTEPVTFFRGSAREATKAYPKNANLAAAVAIASLGFDQTEVELVADPGVVENIGIVHATGAVGTLDVRLSGNGFSDNPKSSQITGMSVLATLANETATICFR
jgi:aspartate dehydrogenase